MRKVRTKIVIVGLALVCVVGISACGTRDHDNRETQTASETEVTVAPVDDSNWEVDSYLTPIEEIPAQTETAAETKTETETEENSEQETGK